MKPLTPQQKKAGWIIAAILVSVHFAPSIIRTALQQVASKAPSRPAKPSAAVPSPPPTPKAPPPQANTEARYVGIWENSELTQDTNECHVRLEIRPSNDQPGSVSGYQTRSCFNIGQFTSGKLPKATLGLALKDYGPVATVLTSLPTDGDSINFRVDKTVGTSPSQCPLTAYSVSPFGAQAIVAQWKGSPCPDGQIVLTRVRGF